MDIYAYRSDVVAPPDLTHFDVEALDGSIGKVDDATNDAPSGELVVDTGFWIFGKKRLIPFGAIRNVDADSKIVQVDLTKDQIKSAPDFDEMKRRNDDYRKQVGDYYSRYGS
jgi:PRC-barrel domain